MNELYKKITESLCNPYVNNPNLYKDFPETTWCQEYADTGNMVTLLGMPNIISKRVFSWLYFVAIIGLIAHLSYELLILPVPSDLFQNYWKAIIVSYIWGYGFCHSLVSSADLGYHCDNSAIDAWTFTHFVGHVWCIVTLSVWLPTLLAISCSIIIAVVWEWAEIASAKTDPNFACELVSNKYSDFVVAILGSILGYLLLLL